MRGSYHQEYLGFFSRELNCDLDGYIHLTAEAWMDADSRGRVGDGWAAIDYKPLTAEEAEELAEETREALAETLKEASDWWQRANA